MGEERKEGMAERAGLRQQCMAQDGIGAVRARRAHNRCECLHGRHRRICSRRRAAAAQHPHQRSGPSHHMQETLPQTLACAIASSRGHFFQLHVQSHPRPPGILLCSRCSNVPGVPTGNTSCFLQSSLIKTASSERQWVVLRTGRFARGRLTWPCGRRLLCQNRRAGSAH